MSEARARCMLRRNTIELITLAGPPARTLGWSPPAGWHPPPFLLPLHNIAPSTTLDNVGHTEVQGAPPLGAKQLKTPA